MHIRLSRTDDWDFIRTVATHPQLWDHLSDDFSGPREAWKPKEDEALVYLKVTDDHQCLGFFLLVQYSPVLWEVHTALLRPRGAIVRAKPPKR